MSKLLFDDPQFEKESREPIVDDTQIKGFFKDYYWLSNFYPCVVTWPINALMGGVRFPSVENMYQAEKIDHQQYTTNELKELIQYFSECSPKEAKIKGDQVKIIDNWDDHKVKIMAIILQQKFAWENNPILCKKLINTGTRYLEETNYWRDTFWGYDRNLKKGKNILGKLLMTIREEIKRDMPEYYFQELQVNHMLGINQFVIPEIHTTSEIIK